MRKKISVSIAVVALVLIGVIATSVFASGTMLANNTHLTEYTNASNQLQSNEVSVTPEQVDSTKEQIMEQEQLKEQEQSYVTDQIGELPEIAVDVKELESIVPRTYEEADAQIIPTRTRFLMYTHDGKHIMWGFVGNNYFVGTDNLGKRCWGIYGKGVFAGFYDGEFFWGRYRNGNWKAEDLFGENYTYGKYIIFPTIDLEPSITAGAP
jgi:hypothetical protein